MSPQTVSLATGLANAGYAVGTVLAVQLAQLLPQRRLLDRLRQSLLVIGSVLAAAAIGPGMFIAGHVLQGLCTSMLLIAAAPPLFLGYPAAKLRWTAVIFNICIFGAVAAGPLVGGAQASFHAWRPLFWIVAGIAALGLLMSLLTFQDAPPADRTAPRDGLAIGLAATGSVAAFWGTSELLTHRFLDPVAVIPLLVGLALIVILWVYQYRARRPLLTVRALASTIPVTGIIVAVCAAAAATSAIGLTATILAPAHTPLHVGVLFVPELVAAVITAAVFGAVFRTRLIHYFALTGLAFLAAGIAVLRITIPPTATLALVGSGPHRHRHRRLGRACAVPGRLLAAVGLDSARVRDPRTAAGRGRVHDRADLAALRTTLTGLRPRREHRPVDLLRIGGRRRNSLYLPLPARRGPAAAASSGARPLDGRPGTGVGLPAAAGRLRHPAPRHPRPFPLLPPRQAARGQTPRPHLPAPPVRLRAATDGDGSDLCCLPMMAPTWPKPR